MVLFQGGDNYFWFWVATALTALTAAAIWYFVTIGRDQSPKKQRRGEEAIERYGVIEEDRAPMPRFLVFTYVGVVVWAVGYAVWTGINGIGW